MNALDEDREDAFQERERAQQELRVAEAMTETPKRWAEIAGKNWQVGYPFCAGCPELVVGGTCAYEGNGCRYPDSRMEMPTSFYQAFRYAAKIAGKSMDELGRLAATEEKKWS